MQAGGAQVLDVGPSTPRDATWSVVNAFRTFGTIMSAEQLHDYIENVHGFAGVPIVRWDAAHKSWLPR
jgi:hypothetical protein